MLSANVELSRKNIDHNINVFRKLINQSNPNTLFCAVVKSNAYGHGLSEITKLCLESKVNLFGVNSLEEAHIIRAIHPSIPILIMGDIPKLSERSYEIQDENFWIMISRFEEWQFLSKQTTRPRIHLKIDTGMGRLGTSGMKWEEIVSNAAKGKLPLDGVATHFASTEDFTEHSYSKMQLAKFNEYLSKLESYGYVNLIRHCAASASALLFDEARMDMVRVGISLYGLWPSIETKLSMNILKRPEADLKPVLSWKSQLQHIQELPSGSFIGYGSTYKTTSPTKVGVVPMGYYEGLDRKLSNNGYMLVLGERAKILGRVCMNMTMIDITHIKDVKLGDEVVIIGDSMNEKISADDLSQWAHTINYETVTKILPHFPRKIVD